MPFSPITSKEPLSPAEEEDWLAGEFLVVRNRFLGMGGSSLGLNSNRTFSNVQMANDNSTKNPFSSSGFLFLARENSKKRVGMECINKLRNGTRRTEPSDAKQPNRILVAAATGQGGKDKRKISFPLYPPNQQQRGIMADPLLLKAFLRRTAKRNLCFPLGYVSFARAWRRRI